MSRDSNNSRSTMMILDEYVAEENSRKAQLGKNTPLLRRNTSRADVRCLPPIKPQDCS
jgi:hypothetical protein